MSELKKGFYLVTADGINTMLRWDGEDWVDMRGIRPCFKEVVQTRYCGENNPVFEQDKPAAYLLRRQDRDGYETGEKTDYGAIPVYTTPQPRKPLTDKQKKSIARRAFKDICKDYPVEDRIIEVIEDIEAAHGIKE